MSSKPVSLGGLVCRVLPGSDKPELAVVLCHGYGAPGTDLVGIAAELLTLRPVLHGRVRFVFPEAPLALDDSPGSGRAWWHIDMVRLERAARTGDASLQQMIPPGMPEARKKVMALVHELAQKTGLPLGKIVLGGFSQGAMVATDVALRLEEAPAGLGIFSGTLLAKDEWTGLAGKRRGLPVAQAHGTLDPLLSFGAAQDLNQLLVDAGLSATFHGFPGGHTIDGEGLRAFADLVVDALAA